jgi:hypothetical protein
MVRTLKQKLAANEGKKKGVPRLYWKKRYRGTPIPQICVASVNESVENKWRKDGQ